MRAGQPSLTASFAAYGRVVASHDPELGRICSDPMAPHMLAAWLRWPAEHAGRARPLLRKAAAPGLVEHMALRTAWIDECVISATAQGVRQVVILGAGLDARAHRLEALAQSRVFEVDYPSTQLLKRGKVAALPVSAAELHYVACDFERIRLEQALRQAGFNADRAALWIWEGVTMYLRASAVEATLDSIAGLSAANSVLIASYMSVRALERNDALTRFGKLFLKFVAEPFHFASTPQDMAQLLLSRGFGVVSDRLERELAEHYAIAIAKNSASADVSRIVTACKQAS